VNNTTPINRSLMAGLAIVLILSMILIACGDDEGTVTPITPTDPIFRQLVALSTVTSWERIWGVSASDMFVMGEDAYVYRGDGFNWDSLLSTIENDRVMYSAWGTIANNVWFVGRITNGITEMVVDSTVSPWDTTWTPIADKPLLAQYDGASFAEELVDFQWGLYDIWGTAADTIFAVGYDGTILRYDGTDWSVITTGGETPAWLNAIWGTSGSSVYTSGTDGALLHFDGSAWSVIPTRSVEDLWDVWGFSDTSIYCVGSGGTVLHYDGNTVTKMTTPTSNTLYSIWGYAENDLYAVGWSGTIIHYDGSTWTEIDSRTTFGFLSVWGTNGGPLYVVGQTALKYDGANWTPIKIRNEPDFTDIWASADGTEGEIVTVGTGGNILFRTSSYSFSSMTIDGGSITTDLNGVGGYSDEALLVVGDGGLILERVDETNWTDMSSGISEDLMAVAMLSDSLAMAVGTGGTLAKYDGSSWTEPDATLLSDDLYDVWLGLTTGDEIIGYAVGYGGTIVEYNGIYWQLVSSPTSSSLRSVIGFETGEAYAVGDNGMIAHLVAGAVDWTAVNTSTIENLTSICAIDATHMFVTAESGRVFSFDGTGLTEFESNTGFDLNGVAGLNATDIYVVGENNHILRYSN